MKYTYHNYTDEEITYLSNNCIDITLKDLTDKFNKKFNLNQSKDKIASVLRRHKIKRKLITTRFKKNRIPWNKGKKTGRAPTNGFKKNHLPPSYKPLGSEKINRDGFLMVKVADPNCWRLKHHIIYEKHHGTKIKRGDKIIFLDGDKNNFNVDNLFLLSNSEQIVLAKRDMISDNVDIMKSYVLLAKISIAIRKLKKRNNKSK